MVQVDCVFCKLKDNPAGVIRESAMSYAVLDTFPIEEGHLLVIPKEHYGDVLSAPDEVVADMFILAKSLAILLKEKTGADGINIATNIGESAGQLIMHAHVHVIPRHSGKPRSFSRGPKLSAKDKARLTALLSTDIDDAISGQIASVLEINSLYDKKLYSID